MADKCEFCNMTILCGKKDEYNSECTIHHDKADETYDIGMQVQKVEDCELVCEIKFENINYCPMCGRKLVE